MRTGMRVLAVALAAAVLASVVSVEAASRTTRRSTTKTTKKQTTKIATYVVIQVKDMQGKTTFEVIPTGQYSDRVKRSKEEYKQAVKQWQEERLKARKAKEKFTEKKPVSGTVKRLGKVFRDQDKAKAYAEKMQERFDARGKKMEKKEDEGDTEKPATGSAKPEATDDKKDANDAPVNEVNVE